MRREVRGQERGQGVGGVFETGGAGWGGRGGGLMSIKLCVIYFSPPVTAVFHSNGFFFLVCALMSL